MNLKEKVDKAIFFYKGYVLEITKKKSQKLSPSDYINVVSFIKRYDVDIPNFIHFSFNLSYEEKFKKKQEMLFSTQDIFHDLSCLLFLKRKDLKNYLSNFDFSFLNDFEYDKQIMIEDDDLHRSLHYNTDNGLIWCKTNTPGYTKESKFCESCINKIKCLKIKGKKNNI